MLRRFVLTAIIAVCSSAAARAGVSAPGCPNPGWGKGFCKPDQIKKIRATNQAVYSTFGGEFTLGWGGAECVNYNPAASDLGNQLQGIKVTLRNAGLPEMSQRELRYRKKFLDQLTRGLNEVNDINHEDFIKIKERYDNEKLVMLTTDFKNMIENPKSRFYDRYRDVFKKIMLSRLEYYKKTKTMPFGRIKNYLMAPFTEASRAVCGDENYFANTAGLCSFDGYPHGTDAKLLRKLAGDMCREKTDSRAGLSCNLSGHPDFARYDAIETDIGAILFETALKTETAPNIIRGPESNPRKTTLFVSKFLLSEYLLAKYAGQADGPAKTSSFWREIKYKSDLGAINQSDGLVTQSDERSLARNLSVVNAGYENGAPLRIPRSLKAKGFDCATLVQASLEAISGKIAPGRTTPVLMDNLVERNLVMRGVPFCSEENLRPGDIMSDSSHVWIVVGYTPPPDSKPLTVEAVGGAYRTVGIFTRDFCDMPYTPEMKIYRPTPR